MLRFFIEPEQVKGKTIEIIGSDVNHIRNVLRLKTKEEVTISDGQGIDYYCIIGEIQKECVILEIQYQCDSSYELSKKITLFQGLPKKDKMEWVIQKSVELGVHSIVPVKMKRTIVKLDEKTAVKKRTRWQGISAAAAKQSKRSIVPEVTLPITFKMMLNQLPEMDLMLVPYESAKGMNFTREVLSNLGNYDKIGIVIGPEGGFDDDEINQLKEMEATIISLGKRILRTETAGMTLLSYLMIQIEEDNDGH